MPTYYKRPWCESRGDEHDGWGGSVWLFEVSDSGEVLRQVELYDGGQRLRYHSEHREDAYGAMSVSPLNLSDFTAFKMDGDEFDTVWSSPNWTNA